MVQTLRSGTDSMLMRRTEAQENVDILANTSHGDILFCIGELLYNVWICNEINI